MMVIERNKTTGNEEERSVTPYPGLLRHYKQQIKYGTRLARDNSVVEYDSLTAREERGLSTIEESMRVLRELEI